jgi:hypothetical protein
VPRLSSMKSITSHKACSNQTVYDIRIFVCKNSTAERFKFNFILGSFANVCLYIPVVKKSDNYEEY